MQPSVDCGQAELDPRAFGKCTHIAPIRVRGLLDLTPACMEGSGAGGALRGMGLAVRQTVDSIELPQANASLHTWLREHSHRPDAQLPASSDDAARNFCPVRDDHGGRDRSVVAHHAEHVRRGRELVK
jgi:hypothetical protein